MDLTDFDATLWAISLAGQLLLLIVVLKRRFYRDFPIFCAYILYSSLSDIVSWIVVRHASDRTYTLVYFANNVPEFLLQLGILYEVGRNVLNPVKRSIPRVSFNILIAMLATGVLLAVLLSRHSQPAQLDRWSQYGVHANFAVAILRLAIFAAIASFSQMLGVGWKNHVLQIATGFLSYSVVVLMVEMLHRFTGVSNEFLYHLHEQFRIVAWCMVLGYWSYVLSRVEAPRKEFSPRMANFLISIGEASRSNRVSTSRGFRK